MGRGLESPLKHFLPKRVSIAVSAVKSDDFGVAVDHRLLFPNPVLGSALFFRRRIGIGTSGPRLALKDSDGPKISGQFRNWRQPSRYECELFRAMEKRPFRNLIDPHVRIKSGRGDPGAVSLNSDYRASPASFPLSESAIECNNAPSSPFSVDGVPHRRDGEKGKSFKGRDGGITSPK